MEDSPEDPKKKTFAFSTRHHNNFKSMKGAKKNYMQNLGRNR